MRKFTFFLSLVVAFVTATAQEVTVTSLDQLSNDKTYFIESARCFLMNNTIANATGISTSTAKDLGTSTVTKDWNDANQQFKIEQIDGNYYLYSVGAAKYVTKDGSWSDTAVDALELTPSANNTYNWKLCIAGNGLNSQNPGQTGSGILVNSWTTEDAGNCYKILDHEASTVVVVDYPNELTEFDQNKCYTVTTTSRGGWAVQMDTEGNYTQFCSTNDAGLGTNSDSQDASQQFAVLSIDGENYYLYSVGAQKFVNSDRSLVAGIAEPIELADASIMGDCRVRVNFKGYTDKYINLGGSNQMIIDSWSAIDAGNAVTFIEATEFDPTAALAMLQPAAELEALEAVSADRSPLETAINGQYKLQGVKINFDEVVKKYTTELSGDYGYILDAEGNEVAKLNKCMGGNGTSNTFATPYASTAIETPGTYKVVVLPGVILSADGTKEYKGGEFEFTVAEKAVEISPSAEEGFCYNETFENIADFSEFVITVKYAKSDVVINNDVKATMTTGETVYEAAVTVEKSGNTQYITLAFDGEFAEGRYTINVPAGLFTVDGVANEEYAKSTFTYRKPQLEISRDFDTWESYLDQVWYMPTAAMITIANAESVEVDDTKVATITFGETVYTSTLNWYHDEWSNAYYIEYVFEEFFAEGFEFAKGDYTFTLPAGAYTVNGEANEEAVKTYTYGDPIIEEFSITEILPAPGSVLESLDAISITFSNGMAADYFPVTCGEKTYYFVSMSGVYVPVDMMSYEPIDITEPGTYTLDLSNIEGLTGEKVFSWTIAEVAAPTSLNETAVFDFANNAWGIPGYDMVNFRGVKTKETYTDGEKSITIDPTANKGEFYYENGYLRIAKPGSKIVLPAFDFAVEKIEVVGHPSASSYPNVDMNVYVGKSAVSTACVGSTATYTYEIAADNQEAGNVYELVIGSNGGNYSSIMFITGIKVYPRDNKLEAPVITPESGVYIGEQTVNVHSVTADIKGVTDITYYYTTDGNEPTVEDEETDGTITISESCTLKVVVELTYGDKTYVSASSSAEYIISEEAAYPKANVMASGKYFIVANNVIAQPFSNGVLPTKQTSINGDNVTDAAYYAYSFEPAGNGEFYIKDANGLYLTATAIGTKDEIKTSTTYHNSAWSVTIEDGVAKMKKEGFVLAYENSAIVVVREENATDATVYPSLYGVSNPPSILSYSPNSYTTELKTISITFSEAIRLEGILSSDQFPIYNAENDIFPAGMGNWTLAGEILTIVLESAITINGDYYITIPSECIVSEVTGKSPAEDIRINLVVYNEDQTSIEDVKGENGNVEVIYDLTGRKVETITKPGIYIVNGKKVLVK